MKISVRAVMQVCVVVSVMGISAGSHAEGQRSPTECLGRVWNGSDYISQNEIIKSRNEMFKQKGAKGPTTSQEWLDVANSKRADICKSMIVSETTRLDEQNNCLITNSQAQQYVMSKTFFNKEIDWDDAQVKGLVERCAASITAQDVVTKNKYFADRYQALLGNEAAQKAAQQLAEQRQREEQNQEIAAKEKEMAAKENEQRHAQTIADAKKLTRNFSIKDINLSLSMAQLIEGATKYWDCKKHDQYESIEICNLAFAAVASVPHVIDTPIGPRTIQTTETIFHDSDKFPPNVRKISTVAGERVRLIQAMFYKGRMFEVDISLEILPNLLKESLSEKYGKPLLDNRNVTKWYGKDEELSLVPSELRIKLENPTILSVVTKMINDRTEAQRLDAQQKERSDLERRKKDF